MLYLTSIWNYIVFYCFSILMLYLTSINRNYSVLLFLYINAVFDLGFK